MRLNSLKYLAGSLLVGFLLSSISGMASTEDAATATNALAVKLLRAFGSDNTAFSPYSIQVALAMVYAGAEGETRVQMASALQYSQADMSPSFGDLQNEVQRTKDKTVLLSANRLFGQTGYHFRLEYLGLVKKIFGSEMDELDFENRDLAARKINSWIEASTLKRIRNVVSPDVLQDARLVLINAIYFKASWAMPFERSFTSPKAFHKVNGKDVKCPTMEISKYLGFAQHGDFSVVTIPYSDEELQFVILLPNAINGLAALERKLDTNLLKECANLKEQNIVLHLPRFKIEPPTLSLSPVLQGLGMLSAFDSPKGSADFNGMASKSPADYLYISSVLHKCFVEVNEEGTEAAAATVVALSAGGGMPRTPPPEIHVDRPFLFAIQHRPTGACLFLGRVVDPSKGQ